MPICIGIIKYKHIKFRFCHISFLGQFFKFYILAILSISIQVFKNSPFSPAIPGGLWVRVRNGKPKVKASNPGLAGISFFVSLCLVRLS